MSDALPSRPAARLLVIDPADRVLLFRFAYDRGPRAGESFWGTPGGALDAGEDFAQAARRELREEVGLDADVGGEVHRRRVEFALPDGTRVAADERYFVVRTGLMAADADIDTSGWTALEREVMREHRWWRIAELEATRETVWPDGLPALLRRVALTHRG